MSGFDERAFRKRVAQHEPSFGMVQKMDTKKNQRVRKTWKKFQDGNLGKTSLKDIEELSDALDSAMNALLPFKEAESTRTYLAFQYSVLQHIIHFRKNPL